MALIKLNNQSLTAVSALPAAVATGSVLQVAQDVLSTQIASNTGSTPTDIGLQVQLTPTNSNSKFLVKGNVFMSSDYTNMSLALLLQRSIGGGSFNYVGIGTSGGLGYGVTAWGVFSNANTSPADGFQLTFDYLDTPSTTSSVDYRILARAYDGNMFINRNSRNNHATFDLYPISTITVMEIGG